MDNFSNISDCKSNMQEENYEELNLRDAHMIMLNILKEIEKI